MARSHKGKHGNSEGANPESYQNTPQTQNEYPVRSTARYSRDAYGNGASGGTHNAVVPPVSSGAFNSAYDPSKEGQAARNAFAHQTGAATASQYSRSNPAYAHRKKRGRGKIVALVVILAVAVVFAGYQVARAYYINQINKQLQGNQTQEQLQQIDDALTGTTDNQFTEPFYVLLIGSDERVDYDEMGARSDTNILCRIDAVNKKITMISIPRDTKIEIDGYGTQKFNAAYEYGGAAATIREASQLTGVSIAHYASVNFDGLTDLVDALGGVDVEVDERIEDEDAGDIVIEAGQQHLNGEAALVFARSRAYFDGDYSRVANQRKLIAAIIDKLMTKPASEMVNMISAASHCATTDMDVASIQALAKQLRSGDSTPTIYSATLPSSTATIDGISYVIADPQGVAEMMKLTDAGEDPSTVATASSVEQQAAAAAASSTSSADQAAGQSGTTATTQQNGGGQTAPNNFAPESAGTMSSPGGGTGSTGASRGY